MSSSRPAVSVVIPAFNEETRLEPTIVDTLSYFRDRKTAFEVIVVDDGSKDGTSALVHRLAEQAPEIRLIRLPENRGKGYAVRSGVLNALGARVLFADADGATPIAEIERLEAELDNGADVAIGSRAKQGDVAVVARWYRRLVGRAFHALVQTVAIKGIVDTQCGFKMFEAAAANDLFSRMRMPGFSFDVEILVTAQIQGYEIAEVPINWTHIPGSRVSLVWDSLRMARDLFIIRANALRGLYRAPQVALLDVGSASDVSKPAEASSDDRTKGELSDVR